MEKELFENEEITSSVELLTEDLSELAVKAEELFSARNYTELRGLLSELPAVDLAELFAELDPVSRPLVFRLLPKETAAAGFSEMEGEVQEGLIASFSDKELTSILEEMYLDDTVDMIEEMPAAVVKRIIRAASPEARGDINRLLRYDGDTAGALMTTEYVRLRPAMTVGDALSHIKNVAIDKETIYTCYVTDENRHLLGIVTAKALLISDAALPLSEIMEEKVIFVHTEDDREECARMFDKYGFIALPVVDREMRLVGIVTVDDAMEVMREETEEDFSKMAAITPTETPYLRTSVLTLLKSRIPWLLLLMISATFSSMILGSFEAALPAVLVLFVPMLMDTGGNSGGQASVTVIRSLSLGEVRKRDVLRVMWHEMRIGILAGLILGVVAFGKVMLIDYLIMGNPAVTVTVGVIVAIAMAFTVIIAKLMGASLPILSAAVGLDPAVMASPVITTLVDAIALLLYFTIAGAMLA